MLTNVLSDGLGTLLAVALVSGLAFLFISDITQKKHGVLRNYPVVGHLRYFFEELGEYFGQHFFSGDREEMPFNRATRAWVYRLAKNEGGTIGFGSTYDMHQPGVPIFVNHPFPVLEEERLATPSLRLGEGYCRQPFEARSVVNVSGMSYGAISAPAVRALARGAATAGCWIDTGEGGLSPYQLEGGPDLVMQIGTANYGVRDARGDLSKERLVELANVAKAFEIKLSQGAKPGKGGLLPGHKVTAEIAQIRGIPRGRDSISPNRHHDIRQHRAAARQDRHGARAHRPAGGRQDRGRRLGAGERVRRRDPPPRPGIRARLPGDRRRRGRLGRGAAGARRSHGPVDRRGAAARGRTARST